MGLSGYELNPYNSGMEDYYNAYLIQEISYKGKKIPIGTVVAVMDFEFGAQGAPCILVGEEIDTNGVARSVWWGIEKWMIARIDWVYVKGNPETDSYI